MTMTCLSMARHHLDYNSVQIPICDWRRRPTIANTEFSRYFTSLLPLPVNLWPSWLRPPVFTLRGLYLPGGHCLTGFFSSFRSLFRSLEELLLSLSYFPMSACVIPLSFLLRRTSSRSLLLSCRSLTRHLLLFPPCKSPPELTESKDSR